MAEEQDGLREHSHIAFEREPEVEPERRRRRAIGPSIPTRRPRRHGQRIAEETDDTMGALTAKREASGIETDRLILAL